MLRRTAKTTVMKMGPWRVFGVEKQKRAMSRGISIAPRALCVMIIATIASYQLIYCLSWSPDGDIHAGDI
jgi:hypothetical protein